MGVPSGEDEALGAVFAVSFDFVVAEAGEGDRGAGLWVAGFWGEDVGEFVAREPVEPGVIGV